MAKSREEIFVPSGPVRAEVATKSGDVVIQVGLGNEARIVLTSSSTNADGLLDNVEVDFDEKSNELRVHTRPRDTFDSMSGIKSLFRVGASSGDLNVMLTLPQGSSINVITGSGDTVTRGSLGDVHVTTGSGDVRVNDTVNSLDVTTGSGDVVAGQVTERLEVKCASGDVRCEGAATSTSIHTASGDVTLTLVRAGAIAARAVSGDIRISVRRGLIIDVDGTTVSGDMESSIPLDVSSSDDLDDESETVSIHMTTVSGDVKISRV